MCYVTSETPLRLHRVHIAKLSPLFGVPDVFMIVMTRQRRLFVLHAASALSRTIP